jgi:hypothetical protein
VILTVSRKLLIYPANAFLLAVTRMPSCLT